MYAEVPAWFRCALGLSDCDGLLEVGKAWSKDGGRRSDSDRVWWLAIHTDDDDDDEIGVDMESRVFTVTDMDIVSCIADRIS